MNTTTKLSIGGAVATVLAGLILRLEGIITDAQIIGALVVVSVVLFYVLLAWVFGAGATEVYKRRFIPRPWTTRAALEMARGGNAQNRRILLRQAVEAKDRIWFAVCVFGGLPLFALLVAHFMPTSPLGWILCFVGGVGVGGLALPVVYRVALNEFWPWLRSKWHRGVEIRRNPSTGEIEAVKDLDEADPVTRIVRGGGHD